MSYTALSRARTGVARRLSGEVLVFLDRLGVDPAAAQDDYLAWLESLRRELS